MRAVLQRVSRASVRVGERLSGEIGPGLLVYLGVGQGDGPADCVYLADKVANLRVFEDGAGLMNLSVLDTRGGLLVVSQFTLYADARKGRRPSYSDAAPPAAAKALYEAFVEACKARLPVVETGEFQAEMAVDYVNEGPVTVLLDSKKTF